VNAADSLYLYPRLPTHAARAIFAEHAGLQPIDLRDSASITHPLAAPNPTGGRPVPGAMLTKVQHAVRELAVDFGFPAAMSMSKQAEFDRICGTLMFDQMSIVPADAGHAGVWSFITLVLLPEVAPWRFRDRTEERYLGGPRNTFQRLWWRAWSLGPDLTEVPSGVAAFGEDEYVQIMERPTISGNQRVARALQAEMHRLPAETYKNRAQVLRRAVIRIRAARSHYYLDLLSDDQLAALMRDQVEAAAAALSDRA